MVTQFLSLIRFSHTLFALPFAFLAAVMAWKRSAIDSSGRSLFRWRDLAGILLCMVFARSAAMAFNRLADRELDAENPRTAGRHLPRGELTVAQVACFALCCGLGFVASTLCFLPNRLPFYLSLPVLAFLLGYSYSKRFTVLSHFWLGAALALAPMAAWIAIRGTEVLADPSDLLPAAVLSLAVLAWVAGFDMLYACQDIEYDRRARLCSVPARFGIHAALRLAGLCHLVTVLALGLLLWMDTPFGWLFRTSILVVALLLAYEHALVRPDDLTRIQIAFFHVNAIISLGLLAAGLLDLWLVG